VQFFQYEMVMSTSRLVKLSIKRVSSLPRLVVIHTCTDQLVMLLEQPCEMRVSTDISFEVDLSLILCIFLTNVDLFKLV
jgi:hypothetical protein